MKFNINDKLIELREEINRDFTNKLNNYYHYIYSDCEVSILIPCFNTKPVFIMDCLKSILGQVGNFSLEIVWIDDCSSEINSKLQQGYLSEIEKYHNTKVIYVRNTENLGVSGSLHKGVNICSNEIIFRMDSDDVMVPDRIIKQLNFMKENKNCVCCGSNIIPFNEKGGLQIINESNHKNILTLSNFKRLKYKKNTWIMNHPTLCFKKSAVLDVGNYDKDFKYPFEDFDLELRLLIKFDVLHNIKESLVYYRIHQDQETIKSAIKGHDNDNNKRKIELIRHYIS